MDKHEITIEDLERLAEAMARHIPDLDCPECCDCGPVYQYMELSVGLYQEEWEWALLAHTIHLRRKTRPSPKT
ncbi:hypothetical protein [Noviherbaspirillum sp.]|uniref:hypothetical protein n=1 Tax=Noviherbaspirillum sp. TaxID=1926288 RepID=UPI002FE19B6A